MSEGELNKNCGVYLIISPSGGRYVGSSKSINKRWNRYKNYSCSHQSAILSSLKKYGVESHKFKMLYYCPESELLFWERVFGDIYLASAEFSNGLNITLPGYDDVPQIRTKEFRDRVSVIQKERFKNEEQRKIVGQKSKEALNRPEIKAKLSLIHKKRFENPELRQQRSKIRKAYYDRVPEAKLAASLKTKENLASNPDLKKKAIDALTKYRADNPTAHGELMKQRYLKNPELSKINSDRLRQYYIDHPEARQLASEKSKKQFENPENNVRCKKVINIKTGEIFISAKIVAKKLGLPYTTFLNKLRGITKNDTPYKYL